MLVQPARALCPHHRQVRKLLLVGAVTEVCRQNLREEASAQFFESNLEQMTRTYLAKASGGRESQSRVT